ncbi:MAG: polysaccharide biosynthesis/export family protein [candidate division Zixibacteria bacterium]|nr:polysaccharide biosynthesis/export family protein [candidate division Zixibacteria bacterium]
MKRYFIPWAGKCALAWVVVAACWCSAGEYKIGPEDVLEINFWQDPNLNSVVRVGRDGKISLDIVGQIEAAGKTTSQLQTDIVHQISRLNKRISQAVVRVVEYNYQYVFVSGQVNDPGKKTFEEIPNLWTIINEAGGITEIGDLSRVTIIRGGDEAGKVEVINVAEAITDGKLDKLPKIRRQDTIEIPRTPAGLPSGELARQIERKNLFYVVGAVNDPGPIRFEENTDILEALALAGGHTENADLKKVRIITKDGYYGQTLQFDLKKYSETGALPRYIMRREDTFIVPQKRGFLSFNLGTVATFVGVVASAILIYDRLSADESSAATEVP